jgi:hypothetical protein
MKPTKYVILTTLLLSACGGNPWLKTSTTVTPDTGTTDTGGITTDGGLPPGTTTPTAATTISRYEPAGKATSGGDSGNGYVKKVSYNSTDDTFKVDNLAFDGDNAFGRATPGALPGTSSAFVGGVQTASSTYSLFDGKAALPDSVTGTLIGQLQHRAIYGVSSDGLVKFAIVRTGNYVDYGFGGFIYSREGGVTLPAEGAGTGAYRGQAHFEGKSAGLRDFKASTGMEMASADMSMDIDFDDFNDGNGVKGLLSNRKVYNLDGTEITSDIISALNTNNNTTLNALPQLNFTIGPGVMNDNGELVGLLSSYYQTSTGSLDTFESGKYYALVSGAGGAQKVVGVLVVEGDDPRWSGVGVRETDGFILVRK